MVSVIIPTYNGKHKVYGILNALEKQSYKQFEVLLVIDGSTDGTAEAFRKQEVALGNFRIIEQGNKGRAAVRNRGAQEAIGDLLIFFDDDMLPLENCVSGHLAHHAQHPDSILTGGLGEETNSDSSEILKFKSYLSNKWTGTLQKDEDERLSKHSIFITAANFSISKKIFNDLGGFDERLNDAEDFDFAVRAYKAGVPLYFKHQVFAWHNDLITGKSYINRLRQYRKAHQYLRGLKPELYRDISKFEVTTPPFGKKTVFNFFAHRYWIKQLDRKGWLTKLPKKIRYKLYDLIITANGVYFPNKVSLD